MQIFKQNMSAKNILRYTWQFFEYLGSVVLFGIQQSIPQSQ